jgi:hypothetical protein
MRTSTCGRSEGRVVGWAGVCDTRQGRAYVLRAAAAPSPGGTRSRRLAVYLSPPHEDVVKFCIAIRATGTRHPRPCRQSDIDIRYWPMSSLRISCRSVSSTAFVLCCFPLADGTLPIPLSMKHRTCAVRCTASPQDMSEVEQDRDGRSRGG